MACAVEQHEDFQCTERIPSYRHSDEIIFKVQDKAQHKALRETRSAPEKNTESRENNLFSPSQWVQKQVLEEKKEAESTPPITYIFWHAKQFQHFHYLYKLTRDCENRVQKLKQSKDQANRMPENVAIKIGIVGHFTADNVKLISKKSGSKNVLCQKSACHLILIKSDNILPKTDRADDFIISVGQDKDQIEEIITSCIEEPLDHMLQKWSEDLKLEHSRGNASDVIVEIEAIRTKLVSRNSIDTKEVDSNIPSTSSETVVPSNVKEYLFGRSDVNSFGLWTNSSFKVFVKNATNVKELKDALITLNKTFFQTYQPEIEIKRWTEMQTLKQGDPIQSKDAAIGTLGGFVTKSNNDKKIYALTCNHLFPNENEPAYANDLKEIGACMFTTRDKGCDFAAIEMKESYVDSCDMAFRRDDKKKTNANVFSNSLETGNIVHKIGATTNVTNGIIVSPEFYLKVTDESTRENVFLVKGTAEKFSERGDSGSLVFSRPNRIQQTYVDVVGMVYANDLTLYDDDDDNDDPIDQKKMKSNLLEGSQEEGVQNNDVNSGNKPTSSKCDNLDKDTNTVSAIHQDTNGISFCYRLHTALNLFKENQGGNFEVKLKDDVSSSESDDSNEGNN